MDENRTPDFTPQQPAQNSGSINTNFNTSAQPAQTAAYQPQQDFHRPYSAAAPQNTGYTYTRQVRPQYTSQGYYPPNRPYTPPPGYYPPTTANAYGYSYINPAYTYQKSPKELELDNLRKAANSGGALTIAIFITMIVVAVILVVIAFFSGIIQNTPTIGDDPHMGFTTMGFYLYEGIASLLSIFIPTLIIMSSAKKDHSLKTDDFLPFDHVPGKKLAAIVFSGIAICMVAQIMAALLSVNLSLFGIDLEDAANMVFGTSAVDVVMNSICTALVPALVEEFAYRGVVLGVLKKYDVNVAIIGSAFLFGMLHGNLGQIPFAFVVGLVLAYVRVKTNSMLPNILIHFGNNFYAVIVTTIDQILPESVSTILDAAVIIVLVIAGFLSIYYLSKTDKDYFTLKCEKSLLTFGEKLKTFFGTGTVIASTIILIIETVAMISLL